MILAPMMVLYRFPAKVYSDVPYTSNEDSCDAGSCPSFVSAKVKNSHNCFRWPDGVHGNRD